jgi:hypothetical protein
MIFFWFLYIFLASMISYLLSLLVTKRYLKIIIFSFSISTLITIWLKSPGSTSIAPIFTIFILESTIIDTNGIERILRPFFLVFLISLVSLNLLWKKS